MWSILYEKNYFLNCNESVTIKNRSRTGIQAKHFFIFVQNLALEILFGSTVLWTQDNWVRSTNTTSVLCGPLELYLDSFKVEFPAVTICASGRNDNNLEAGFWNLFLKFMDEAGSPLPYSAVQVANKMRQVTSAMWHILLNGPFLASFLYFVFSG